MDAHTTFFLLNGYITSRIVLKTQFPNCRGYLTNMPKPMYKTSTTKE